MTFFVRSILFFLLVSCTTGINFNPDLHIASSELQAIISERNDIIYTNEERFNEFACMHKEKIKELAEILKRARLPKELETTRSRILKDLQKIQGGSNI